LSIAAAGSSGACFGKSLFIVGEFGVNDYSFIFSANKTEAEARSYVPKVVRTIASAVEVRYSAFIYVAGHLLLLALEARSAELISLH
jgi:hypothetical protein